MVERLVDHRPLALAARAAPAAAARARVQPAPPVGTRTTAPALGRVERPAPGTTIVPPRAVVLTARTAFRARAGRASLRLVAGIAGLPRLALVPRIARLAVKFFAGHFRTGTVAAGVTGLATMRCRVRFGLGSGLGGRCG